MSIDNLTIPLILNPSDIQAIIRQAQDARADAIRAALLQLPATARKLAARLRYRPHLPRPRVST
jgi:hypothetical protein